jgi:hypothetical protein
MKIELVECIKGLKKVKVTIPEIYQNKDLNNLQIEPISIENEFTSYIETKLNNDILNDLQNEKYD